MINQVLEVVETLKNLNRFFKCFLRFIYKFFPNLEFIERILVCKIILKSADIQLIQRIIPHRYPFLLVDKVIEIDYLKSATGIKNVTLMSHIFRDISLVFR